METITSLIPLVEVVLKSPFQAVISLIIFLLALPLIMKGRRDKPTAQDPEPAPVQVESPWLVIELNTISNGVQEMHRDLRELSRVMDRLVASMHNRDRSIN